MNSSSVKPVGMEIILKGLNFQHQAKFIKLVTLIREEHHISEDLVSDSTALRFYSSVDGNLDIAIDAIQRHTAWRKTYDFKKALTLDLSKFSVFQEHVKMGYYGTDSKGRPIRIIYITKFNPDIILDTYTEEELTFYQLQIIERLINIIFPMCSAQSQRNVNNMITIIDVKDLEISKVILNKRLIDLFRVMAKTFQDNFPEITYRAIIVNTDLVFMTLWKIISIFIKQKTLEKVKILDNNYLPEVTKYVSLEQLPLCLGGTCPHPIDQFPNFFDPELQSSMKERRLRMKSQA